MSTTTTNDFDPLIELNSLLEPAGLSTADTGGKVTIVGEDPLFSSAVRLGSAFSLSALSAAVGAAAIWRENTGEGQDLFIDIRKAGHGINPHMTFHPTIQGHAYPDWMGGSHPFSAFPYETRDGRYVYPSAVYPHQQVKWLRFFDCSYDRYKVAERIKQWDSHELEDTANEQGNTLCIARTPEEWLAHPQGEYLATEPVIAVRRIGDSAPEKIRSLRRPLDGVRVLSGTHAVAGPVVGRTLAEQGAQVLQFNHPNDFEHEWVYDDANVGFRSTYLDLKNPQDNRIVKDLTKDTDIFVDNYRGRKLADYGLSPEELAELRPGIIIVSVRCYGWGGPWYNRGGFDMLGSAASGLAMLEGKDGVPSMPPTDLINDYVTGYLGAAGATAALLRRQREGGSYHVTVSLARNAMWYQSMGIIPEEERSFEPNYVHRVWNFTREDALNYGPSLSKRLLPAEELICDTPLGKLRRMAPVVTYSKTPAYWADPVLTPRGAANPQWL